MKIWTYKSVIKATWKIWLILSIALSINVFVAIKVFAEEVNINDWRIKAQLLHEHNLNYDCKGITTLLIKKLNEKKIEFKLVHGWYSKHPHRWIEINGQIIDPLCNYNKKWLYEKR